MINDVKIKLLKLAITYLWIAQMSVGSRLSAPTWICHLFGYGVRLFTARPCQSVLAGGSPN